MIRNGEKMIRIGELVKGSLVTFKMFNHINPPSKIYLMTKRAILLIAAITLSCSFNMKATSAFKNADPALSLKAPAFAWNFTYAFGNGPVPGLSWSGNYLYVSSGSYVVYSANGYGFLTPSTPVYCNAQDNANTYVQVAVGGGGSGVSYYDFSEY